MIFCHHAIAQVDQLDEVSLPSQFDQAVLSVWEVHYQEMNMPGMEISDYELQIDKRVLSSSDAMDLLIQLQDSSSYRNSRALPYHFNLKLDFFWGDEQLLDIKISGLTGNIDIHETDSETYFQNSCSYQLGESLISLLESYKLMQHLDEFDLMGIRPAE